MQFKKKNISTLVSALCLVTTTQILAEDTIELKKYAVTATRAEESIASIPESMTVLSFEEIQQQVTLSNGDLSDALGKLIPGFSIGNQSMSNYGQNLRGRKASILVDGVPQNPIFDPGKNLAVIDTAMIEKIEVIRGATAIYGDGATGGIINIITKKPENGVLVNNTTVGMDLSLTHPGDSLGSRVKHISSGRQDQISYLFGAALQDNKGWFDADGDRIAPNPHRDGGLSDTDQYNLFGKLGLDLNDEQTVVANLNLFRNTQDTDYIGDLSQRYVWSGAKARAISGLYMEDEVGVRNATGGLDYNHTNFLGSRLHIQIYHKDYWARSNPFDDFGTAVYQDTIKSKKTGARFEIDTPLIDDKLSVLWGADYSHERISQTVKEMDMATYLASNKLIYTSNGVQEYWLNPYTQDNYAVFAQGELYPAEKWVLRAGIRHERVNLDIPDFVTLSGKAIVGGTPDFSTTLYNLGAVYSVNNELNVFANFSQGFSLPDVRQKLRTGSGGTSVEQLNIEPEKVDNYELGIRADWARVTSTVAIFYNKSDLGANPPPNFTLPVTRAPERIYGVEATVDWKINQTFTTGGTLTWSEGKQNKENDGLGYIYLNNQRIRPPKLTAYIEHQTMPSWRNRFQLLVSGHRDRFNQSTAFAKREVSGYATLDWLSEVDMDEGKLIFGITNLLNRLYYTPQSQQFLEGDVTHAASKGATFSASYNIKW